MVKLLQSLRVSVVQSLYSTRNRLPLIAHCPTETWTPGSDGQTGGQDGSSYVTSISEDRAEALATIRILWHAHDSPDDRLVRTITTKRPVFYIFMVPKCVSNIFFIPINSLKFLIWCYQPHLCISRLSIHLNQFIESCLRNKSSISLCWVPVKDR